MHVELIFARIISQTRSHRIYTSGINFTSNNIRTSTNLLKFTIRVMCHSIHPLCLLTFEYRQSSMKYLSSAWNLLSLCIYRSFDLSFCLSLSISIQTHSNEFLPIHHMYLYIHIKLFQLNLMTRLKFNILFLYVEAWKKSGFYTNE